MNMYKVIAHQYGKVGLDEVYVSAVDETDAKTKFKSKYGDVMEFVDIVFFIRLY